MPAAPDPLPDCGTDRIAAATPHPAAIARVCILDDRQLLSVLAETGGSFGLVRVGERTVVVRDSEPISGDGG